MVARVKGLIPLCPHTMYRFFQFELPDEYWLNATLNLLDRCDSIFMIPNWEGSEGAKVEYEFAVQKGIPVFLTFGDLVRHYADLFEGEKTNPSIPVVE
jgi:hypothetical protein